MIRATLVAGLAAAATLASSAQPAPPRPNILLILADDWSYPHAGVFGDRVVTTPTFDRIAREGVLFRNAFVAAPSCTPSRASLLTGRAVHHVDPWDGYPYFGPPGRDR